VGGISNTHTNASVEGVEAQWLILLFALPSPHAILRPLKKKEIIDDQANR
jgi:hypothetical protein